MKEDSLILPAQSSPLNMMAYEVSNPTPTRDPSTKCLSRAIATGGGGDYMINHRRRSRPQTSVVTTSNSKGVVNRKIVFVNNTQGLYRSR